MSQYVIALQKLDPIDFEVISQAITQNYPKTTIQEDIDTQTSLVISPDAPHDEIPSLQPEAKIGILLDKIEACLFTKMHSDIKKGLYHLIAASMTLLINDKSVLVTETEWNILEAFLNADGMELSRDQLLKSIWGYVDGVETHTLETHIYRLRQKIEVEPDNPKYLVTIDGGYKLASE